MSLADSCRKAFSSQDVQRGTDYFEEGAVHGLRVDGTVLSAKVSGSESSPYDVILDWQDATHRILKGSCSCPRFADFGLCKHVFATILAADDQGLAPPGIKGRFNVYELNDESDIEEDEGDYEDDDEYEDSPPYLRPTKRAVSVAPRNASAKKNDGRRTQPEPWKQQFAVVKAESSRLDSEADRYGSSANKAAKPRQAWFLFDTRECTARGELMIRFYSRELKKNGAYSKLKTLTVRRHELTLFGEAEDRDALNLFLGMVPSADYGYYSPYDRYSVSTYREYAQCELSPAMSEILLPKLCARPLALGRDRRSSRAMGRRADAAGGLG